jgi:hypothetical protein
LLELLSEVFLLVLSLRTRRHHLTLLIDGEVGPERKTAKATIQVV